MHRARFGCGFTNSAHVFERVHARELLVGGERRLVAREMLANARSDQLVLDRGEARRALGMMRAHIVLEAVGVCDKCRGHAISILCHRVQSFHAAESRIPPTKRLARADRARDRSRGQDHPGQGEPGAAFARLPARARTPPDRGPARRGQDHARARAREVARPAFPAHPVHQRHAARRHHRRLDLRARERRLQVPSRADLRPGDPRRRGQPRHAQDAVGAARGDGRAPGHRRRRDAQAARAVLRHRHAEPFRARRHLPAARVAARPLHDAHRARLPRPRRRARAALGHRPARPARDARPVHVAGRADGAAGRRAKDPRRAGAARLRAGDRRAHAALARVRRGAFAARRARPRAHRARLGAARRPRQGDSGGRAGDPCRGRRAPPAAGARLGKARRRRRAAAVGSPDPIADTVHPAAGVQRPSMRDSFGLPLAFFASGAAGLLFEVLWFRAPGRVLGNTVWAGALVLTAFMLGIALGGLLAARWAQRIRRPARVFAAAEATIALSGSLLVWGLPAAEIAIGDWLSPLAEHSTTVAALRLLFALAAMLIPTTAMGMTLALGVRILAHRDTTRSLGVLYAANTFGACIAPLVAEYLLIGALGLRGTALVAAGLDLLAAAVVLAWQSPAFPRAAPPPAAPSSSPARLLLAAAGAGPLALALEVIWFRLLILFAPGTDTTFAIMLTLVLAGIALGGALAPLLARLPLVWVTTGSSLAVVLGYLLASPLQGSGQAQLFRYAIPLMLPAAVFSGSLFTLLGAQLRADAENPQPAIGRLTSANTLGAALGAAAAGFVLLPYLGIESSLFLLAAGYALLPVLLVDRRAAWKSLWPAVAAAAGLLFFPFGWIEGHLAQAAFVYRFMDGSTVAKDRKSV